MKALSVPIISKRKGLTRPDKLSITLALLVAALCAFSLFVLYSASFYAAEKNFGDGLYYLKKQALAMGLGVITAVVLSFINAEKLKKAAIPLLVVSFVLLGIIFIPALGVESYGARRWLNLGFITMQPSEVSKFGLVFFSAFIIDKYKTDTLKGGLPILLVGIAMCVLLLLEPNMSVTVLTATLMMAMLFAGGVKTRKFAYILLPLIAGAVLLILLEPYRLQRLTAFIDPWASPKGEGYQLIQSYYALGSGGWFGTGYLKGRQKYMFLPFAESDFIFAIVGEEFGFVGAILLIAVYMAIAITGYKIAARAQTRFQAVLAYGISSVIVLQTLINVAVVSGSIPPTGIPLPFMSYGGSSLVCFLSSIGILESVARNGRAF
ncbi:MAG: putative lipid II flippase FtsW [Clostridia bacterium]|nr:putative lipid II flippase FtsW [Clostridia bacterium]